MSQISPQVFMFTALCLVLLGVVVTASLVTTSEPEEDSFNPQHLPAEGEFEFYGHGTLIFTKSPATYADRGYQRRLMGLHFGPWRYHTQGSDAIPMLYLYDKTDMLKTRIVHPFAVTVLK